MPYCCGKLLDHLLDERSGRGLLRVHSRPPLTGHLLPQALARAREDRAVGLSAHRLEGVGRLRPVALLTELSQRADRVPVFRHLEWRHGLLLRGLRSGA